MSHVKSRFQMVKTYPSCIPYTLKNCRFTFCQTYWYIYIYVYIYIYMYIYNWQGSSYTRPKEFIYIYLIPVQPFCTHPEAAPVLLHKEHQRYDHQEPKLLGTFITQLKGILHRNAWKIGVRDPWIHYISSYNKKHEPVEFYESHEAPSLSATKFSL